MSAKLLTNAPESPRVGSRVSRVLENAIFCIDKIIVCENKQQGALVRRLIQADVCLRALEKKSNTNFQPSRVHTDSTDEIRYTSFGRS